MRILITLLMLLNYIFSTACDACGGGGNIGSIGWMGSLKNNSVRLSHQYIRFKNSPRFSSGSEDRMKSTALQLRYYISKRIKLIYMQSYVQNERLQEQGTLKQEGFGDLNALIGYSVVNATNELKNTTLFTEINAGFSFPTGAFDANMYDKNLPLQFNPGRNAKSFVLQANAMYKGNSAGISASILRQVHGLFVKGYRFGNQFSSQVLFFLELKASERMRFYPSGGILWEHIDKDHYANGKEVSNSGGKGTYAQQSINVQFSNVTLSYSHWLPITEHYADGDSSAQSRSQIQLNYRF